MRRACLDIASNYFKSSLTAWITTPDDARDYFRVERFRFDGATVFDSPDHATDFVDYSLLFEYLSKADELISFNGRTCDLIVLEKLIGRDRMDALWRKPHHDLQGWRNTHLKGSLRKECPEIAPMWEEVEVKRRVELGNAYDSFTADRLAGTFRDAKLTFALFERYLASGDSSHTFHDSGHLSS
jgi:hypothetical protein